MFKKKLDELSDIALSISGTKYDYSDEDLSNAMIVLMEVLLSKIVDKHSKVLSFEGLEKIAELSGRTFHDLILEMTGVDLHKIYE